MERTRRLGLGVVGTLLFLEASCSLQTEGLSSGSSDRSPSSSASQGSSSGSSSGSNGSGSGGAGTGMGGGGGGPKMPGVDAGPPLAVAVALLVDLDAAKDATAGTGAWINKGTLSGAFMAQGQPTLVTSGSVKAVQFDGFEDAYIGPPSAPGIEGNNDRSIEVWVNNPLIGNEEAMVSWSQRGGITDGTMMSFNYGFSASYGAMAHWGTPDLGWSPTLSGLPKQGEWHHLAYTFDGTTARVYADGVEKSSKAVKLATQSGFSINLAMERNKNNYWFNGSLLIAVVRIHDGALTAAEVMSNFTVEKPQFP